MKELARNTNDPTREVLRQATQNVPEFVQVNLPTSFNMKRQIQRARYGNDRPVEPRNLADLEIPDAMRLLNEHHGNELFLKYDSGQEAGNNR